MRISTGHRAMPSITALSFAIAAGLLECVALWRSRRRAPPGLAPRA